MKKLILLFAFAVLLFSCKPKEVVTSKKTDYKTEAGLKGNWTITSVTFPGSDYIKVNSFQIADSKCFVGSNWKFVPNNDTGEMLLTKTDCPSFSSPIQWYINKDQQFVLKILNAGVKAKKVREGYILRLAAQTEDSFQLIDKIDVGGTMTDVIYQFSKNQ